MRLLLPGLVAGAALLSGCFLLGAGGGGHPGGDGDGGGGGHPGAETGTAGGDTGNGGACAASSPYDTVEAQLNARRSTFLGVNVQNLTPVNNRVYWYDTTNYVPVLNGYTDGSGAELKYTFNVGDSIDSANWRASDNLIVTAHPSAGGVTYRAYDPSQASKAIGTINVAAPVDASYWAYAVDAENVYLVMLDATGHNALVKWVPAAGTSTSTVTTLESAGATVGEFWDFDVSGNTMVFIESGLIWTLDIPTNKAMPLGNTTEVNPSGQIDFETDGVMFTTDTALMFFQYATGKLRNLSEEINAKKYSAGACSVGASRYVTDFARWGSTVAYIGEDSGVFAYDLVADVISPVLLPPASGPLTVQYRYPVALSDGTLFVTGLTSTDGTTGADGPTYKVDLSSLLK